MSSFFLKNHLRAGDLYQETRTFILPQSKALYRNDQRFFSIPIPAFDRKKQEPRPAVKTSIHHA